MMFSYSMCLLSVVFKYNEKRYTQSILYHMDARSNKISTIVLYISWVRFEKNILNKYEQ